MGQAADWLEYIFSGVEEGYVTVTAMESGGRTHIYRIAVGDFAIADQICLDHAAHNVYYNVGIQRDKLGGSERGSKRDVQCITSVWVDLDSPKAASVKRYPTAEHIASALADMPLRHSALVQTGNGVHAYWRLNEPLIIGCDQAKAEEVEQGVTAPWGNLMRSRLKRYGDYQIDSVFDCTRMLRLPGSIHQSGVAIRVVDRHESAYYIEDIRMYAEGEKRVYEKTVVPYTPKLSGDFTGELPERKFNALMVNCRDFRQVWEGKKTYESGSERDASLAKHAAIAGWSDMEIGNLLWKYAQENAPERIGKMMRPDYIPRTIEFVRQEMNRIETLRMFSADTVEGASVAVEAAQPQVIDDAGPGDAEAVAEEAPADAPKKRLSRDEIIERLRGVLGIPIARWIQVGLENPIYTLVLDDGRQIKIGGEKSVLYGMRLFHERIYSELRLAMRQFTQKEWGSVCQGLANIAEVIEVPEVSTRDNAMWAIRVYLEKNHWYSELKRDYAYAAGMAVREGGKVFINVNALVKFMAMQFAQKWTNAEFVNAIRQLGFDRISQYYKSPSGGRACKSYWGVDDSVFQDLFSKEELAQLGPADDSDVLEAMDVS